MDHRNAVRPLTTTATTTNGHKPQRAFTMFHHLVSFLTILCLVQLTGSEVLNPPYFNIAEGRRINATETCGEKGKEFYCKIIGSMWSGSVDFNQDSLIVQGQACDYCDPNDPKKSHPAEYAIDGSPRWWQSPPLSRGPEASRVNLTIDLGQEFHVAYVYITMANSPRPGVWVLERSTDTGVTFTPWMYFADSREECIKQFGEESVQPLTRDDQVICETKYSKLIPLENGEIAVPLIEKRPSSDNFTSSEVLQNFTKATNIRLRFIRPQTTFGHLLNTDQTVTRRYFYSIRDINIGGRCVCNGHAETCDIVNQTNPEQLSCACQHNTDGPQCNFCKPGYAQKRWKPSTPDHPFVCEPCNCNNHSDICTFDGDVEKNKLSMDIHGNYEGGGRCLNCTHPTTGINCQECKFGYYRPTGVPLNDPKVCVKCASMGCTKTGHSGGCDTGTGVCQCLKNFTNAPACDQCAYGYYNEPECPRCPCYRNGTLGDTCDPGNGKCICKGSFSGPDCSACAPDYWGFPECQKCNCDADGSSSPNCDPVKGQCVCRKQFTGRQCDSCSIGFFNYPKCDSCNCDPRGTTDEVCDRTTGQCKCKPGFTGDRCDQCEAGFYKFPSCLACACDPTGSTNQTCNEEGKCSCAPRFGGSKCSQCAAGYYDFPKCETCGCDPAGSIGVTCQNGICQCRDNFEGVKCNKCKKNYYNFPICESCSCNPAGVVPNFPGCSEIMSGKLCECKEKVTGRYCDTCAPHYKFLRASNVQGCEPCRCNRAGSLNSLDFCDGESGQCACKESATGTACDKCSHGTYALSVGNYLGCVPCDCDLGGSYKASCDQRTGSCSCKFRIEGRRCDRPQKAHYFYNTYQYLYELEDGRGEYHPVRYDYNETDFPGFSWKGYAKFEKLQKKIIIDFVIIRSSFYRVIFHYHNPEAETIYGNLTISNENEIPQVIKLAFPPTTSPKKYLIPMDKTAPLYLFAAQRPWKASLSVDTKAEEKLLVDYIVFLPQAYFEATILRENVTAACTISTANHQLCRHYGYTNFPDSAATYPRDAASSNVDLLQDSSLIDATLLSDQDRDHTFELDVEKSQKYVLILSYVYRVANPPPKGQVAKLTVEVNTVNGTVNYPFQVPMCQYTFPCRHVVLNDKAAPVEFHLESGSPAVSVKLNNEIGEATFGILRLVFLPRTDWHIDHVKPSLNCIMRNQTCLDMSFDSSAEATKFSFGSRGNVSPINSNVIEGSDGTQYAGIEVVGMAPRTDNYKLVIHYYQPSYPSFDIEATFQRTPTSPLEQAHLSIAHCPSKSGCRAIVKFKKPLGVLEEGKEFTLALTPPKDRGVTLDYLILANEKTFTNHQLDLPVVDRSTEFLRNCVQDAFYIDDNSSEFCKQALFTLSTSHNNGGAFCSCNQTGSQSYTCNPLGGQCDCKPNVIGRECKACRSDYYGFPNCKPCNCPPNAAYCEPVIGKCICPKNVVGPNCDRCADLTYGYDSKMGCEFCNCHPTGVKNNNLQCDLNTGLCDCKDKYDGRACDSCKSGFFDFPVCRQCSCNLAGSKLDICDRTTGECKCKDNVLKPNCDICRRGTYNLEASNPLGCTKCFCFGTTENCRSSDLRLTSLRTANMSEWATVGIIFDDTGMRISSLASTPVKTDNDVKLRDVPIVRGEVEFGSGPIKGNVYFKAPNELLGNHITSYGGFIRYEIIEIPITQIDPIDTPITPDVVLTGRNHSISLTLDEQPTAPGSSFKVEIELLENKFVHLSDSTPVSRAQLMTTLVELTSIYIRGSYFTPIELVTFANFSMDSVSNDPYAAGPLALRVEQCICPPNYKGSSCEECASGHYRIQSGLGLGACVQCQCNGHSNECDPVTGKCFNCKHNTRGDYCELCVGGYYGNATMGTPYDCSMCPCPGPINNFAESCEVRADSRYQTEIVCNCKKGYAGPHCDLCGVGHFGYPLIPGNYCQPCQCNGNIDPTDPLSCNPMSGECLKCLNNAAGKSCEYCADDYFGDAVGLKNCRPCACDEKGTKVCDRYTGTCECQPNVIGESCDECKPNHYGFNTGLGCKPCNCSNASQTESCDMDSGQCTCQPGVTGRTCDECEIGYWKFSPKGCESCGCVEKYSRGVVCNQKTGRCECLPGVVGEKCDKCPWRWVFVDREGCLECGECQHALLNDTDTLDRDIQPVLNEFSNSSSGIHAKKKYVTLNNSVTEYNQQLASIVDSSKDIDLSSVETASQEIASQADGYLLTQERISRLTDAVLIKVAKTTENATLLRRQIKQIAAELVSLLKQINEVDLQYDQDSNTEQLRVLTEMATANLGRIERVSFSNVMEALANESASTLTALDQVKTYIAPYMEERIKSNQSKVQLDKLESVLNDANKKIIDSMSTALNVQRGLNRSRETIKELIIPQSSLLKNLDSAISDNLKEAKAKIDSSGPIIQTASGSLDNLAEISNSIQGKYNDLSGRLQGQEDLQTAELRGIVERAGNHSLNLNQTATELELVFQEAIKRGNFNRTMKAVTAYEVIEDYIESSERDMNDVIDRMSAENWEGVRDKIGATRTASLGNRTEASTLRASILNNGTSRLSQLNNDLKERESVSIRQGDQLQKIDSDLASIESSSTSEPSRQVLSVSESSVAQAEQVSGRVDRLIQEVNSLLNATNQLTEEEKRAFVDIHTSSSLTSLHGEKGIGQKIRDAAARVSMMMKTIDESKSALKRLQASVLKARNLANRIDVPMRMGPGSFAQLRKPEDLESSGSYNKLSLHFATNSPDGLLAYVGNPKRSGAMRYQRETLETTDDYIALLIRDGRIVVVLDLGSGPQYLATETRVDDRSWVHLIVERIGKTLKITINKDNREIVTHGHIDGFSSVLDLNSQRTKIFIGSIPEEFVVPEPIKTNSFTGSLFEVTLGDTPLGLLNFQNGNYVSGDYLPNKVAIAGMHFNGKGWASAIVDPKTLSQNSIAFKVKTFARSGLILLMAGIKDYLAIQLEDGRPKAIIELGSGYTSIVFSDKINDGNEHVITFSRELRTITLGVFGRDPVSADTSGSETTLELDSTLYIGGHPGGHNLPEVTRVPYEGCFSDLEIDGLAVALTNATMTTGVTAGCPESGVREAVFETEYPGYIEMPLTLEIVESVQISLKFRTNVSDGLLFLASPLESLESFLAIYLNDGRLTLSCMPLGKKLQSYGVRYDNNDWHYVMATKSATGMRLDIDDKIQVEYAIPEEEAKSPGGFNLNIPAGSYYLGGVPKDRAVPEKVSEYPFLEKAFSGCLGDVVVHDRFQDLRKSVKVEGATLVTCKIISDGRPPAPLTPTESDESTDVPPVTTTELPRGPCALPYEPVDTTVSIAFHGARFGGTYHSRAELKIGNDVINSLVLESQVSFEFKTYPDSRRPHIDGILFFLADAQYVDLFVVYMKDGQLFFTWNLGGGVTTIGQQRNDAWDDGSWHQVSTGIKGKSATITYPDGLVVNGIAPGQAQKLNIASPAYVGGIPKNAADRLKGSFQNVTRSFLGCIGNVVIGKTKFNLEETSSPNSPKLIDTASCTENQRIEDGTFFPGQNSYLSCYDKFKVGNNIQFRFKIRPRNNTGLLMAIFGALDQNNTITDYLIVKMVDGKLIAEINNGIGPKISEFSFPTNLTICDGNWLDVKVWKIQNAHSITISDEINPVFGPGGITVADTISPLYIGGVPDTYRRQFTDLPPAYVGCLKSMEVTRPAFGDLEPIMVNPVVDCQNFGSTRYLCPTF